MHKIVDDEAHFYVGIAERFHNALRDERLEDAHRKQQAQLLSRTAIEGLPVNPEVIDELMLRHNLGHVAVDLGSTPLPASEAANILQHAA